MSFKGNKSAFHLTSKILNYFGVSKKLRVAKGTVKKSRFESRDGIILVEANQSAWAQLALSLFLPIASEIYQCKPVTYYMRHKSFFISFKEQIRQFFSVSRAMGVKKFIVIGKTRAGYKKIEWQAKILANEIRSKKEFENFHYRDVRIGDLVYDQYLRAAQAPTINFQDDLFIRKLAEAMSFVDEVLTLFSRRRIGAVCVSHTVYSLAIPARIALNFNVPAFQVNGEHVYRLSNQNTHAYTDFKYYPEIFRTLPSEVQLKGLQVADKRLQKRMNGDVGVDMPYSTFSAFHKANFESIEIVNSKAIKVLVAVHDFFDSPHSFGDNLFPDFMEWLNFLGEMAKKTDYQWFLKTHGDVVGKGQEILETFQCLNPNFSILPKKVSHHKLIEGGINVVLTMYGSIASEYAYLGNTAINASINNPHVNYNFCISPQSIEEYGHVILNLPTILNEFQPDKREVLKFYFMHHIYKRKSWIIKDVPLATMELGGYKNLLDWEIFPYFANGLNSFDLGEINAAVANFLMSKDFVLERRHFGHMGLDFYPNY